MSAYTDLERFLSDDGITTPKIKSVRHPGGKSYVIPSPNAQDGLWLTTLANIGIQANAVEDSQIPASELAKLRMDDNDERDFYERVLGTAYAELMEDGVSWVVIQRLSSYAFTYFAMSPDTANEAIQKGAFGGPAAPKAPQDRKAKSTTAATSRRSPGSAASRSRKNSPAETLA